MKLNGCSQSLQIDDENQIQMLPSSTRHEFTISTLIAMVTLS